MRLHAPQWGRASEGSETAEPEEGRLFDASRNGAEPRKARRRATPAMMDPQATEAAMGPSLGRLGDPKGPSKCLESELPPPQWGRASEGSETVGILTATGTGCKVPQWGRASEGSETRAELEAVADGLGAAMGPSLGRLGDPASSPRRLCQPRHRAAMGPSLGRLGDPGLRARHLALIMAAAMGPSLGRLGDRTAPHANRVAAAASRNGAEPRKARRRLLEFGAVEQAKRWRLRVGWFECWECCDDQWNDFAVLAGHSGGEHLLGFGANRAARSG